MFIEHLSIDEIKDIVEHLDKQYTLRRSSCIAVFEPKSEDDALFITLSRGSIYYGLKANGYDYCHLTDFDFTSNMLHGQDEVNAVNDFRRIMYHKFKDEYKKELKKFLEKDKKAKLKAYENQLEQDNSSSIEELEKE